MLRTTLRISLWLWTATAALGGEVIRDIPLEPATKNNPDGVRYQPPADEKSPGVLILNNRTGAARTFSLASVDAPGIKQPAYAVVGEVQHEQVQGDAYLMTINHVGAKGYFSKGMLDEGRARKLTGSSDWRPFSLPFYCDRGDEATPGARPDRIELKLVMPNNGTVRLRNVKLMQYAAGENPIAAAGAWWSGSGGGLLGGIAGGAVGVVGAVIGVLAGRGRAPRVVLTLVGALAIGGVAGLAAGLAALVSDQPYDVWYPLLLIGGICALLATIQFPILRHRYAQLELRRMAAMDAA